MEMSPPAEGAAAPAHISSEVAPSYVHEAAVHGDDVVATTGPGRAPGAAAHADGAAVVVDPTHAQTVVAAHAGGAAAGTGLIHAQVAAAVVAEGTRSRGWGTGHVGAGEAVSFRTPAWLHRQRVLPRSRHEYR